jgi:hypothetical protein
MSMFFQQKPSAISQNLLTESWNFLFFRCYKFSALISTDYFLRSWFCNWRCLFWDSQQHSLMQTTLNLTVTLKCSLFHVNFGYLKLKNNLIFFSEADFFWFYVITRDICNKFIEIKFYVECMVWPWCSLLQPEFTLKI